MYFYGFLSSFMLVFEWFHAVLMSSFVVFVFLLFMRDVMLLLGAHDDFVVCACCMIFAGLQERVP